MARRSRRSKLPAQTIFRLGLDARTGAPEAQAAYEAARRAKYRDLFDTLLGREVLADFLATVGFFAADAPHERDVANYRNGMRAAGAEILKAMGLDSADALTAAMIGDDLGEVFDEAE
ncbi:MAG: hypothetical protein BroJett013_30480 [Alphaproteobacteria bacterium]|nr:MAG: hypothetical protein BroJett013_30480 [Alphaproteobacteria bacterium]